MTQHKRLSSTTKGDIFDDRDLFTPSESAVLKVKDAVLTAIIAEVRRRDLKQKEVARILDEYQPNVSNLLRGKISKFSTDKLVEYAAKLGLMVRIEMDFTTENPASKSSSRRRNGRAVA